MSDADLAALVAAGPRAQTAALDGGGLSVGELVAATLARVRALDGRINAFVSVDDEAARRAAADADRRRLAGERGPLLGVPVGVKDDLDEAGRRTGRGTRAGFAPAARDAEVLRRLAAAGAVPIGRTTLPELAVYGFTESRATGETVNPLDPSRTPGGSSGGSAAAVAAGMIGLATASDGAGSIRIPAACCGLPGFKPTAGAVPTPPHWYGLSVQGCLTRELADAAVYLDAVGDLPTSLVEAARTPLPRLRVGIDLHAFPAALPSRASAAVEAAVRATADRLADTGHDVREVRLRWGLAGRAFGARYLRGITDSTHEVEDPRLLEPRTRHLARLGSAVPPAVARAAARSGAALGGRLLADAGVDVVLGPAVRGEPVAIGRWAGLDGVRTTLSMGREYAWTAGWNHLGAPAVVLPLGRGPSGLPVAVQLAAAPGDDARLMSLAASLEPSAS